MKTLFTAIFAAATAALTAGTVVIDDFEKGKIDGWLGYQDAESAKSQLALTDETLSGDGALKATFQGCKRYQGLQFFKAPVPPANAVAVSFLLKPVSGAPPTALAFAERQDRYGKDLSLGVGTIKAVGNDWQKITVRLDSLRYASGPERNKPYPFKPGAIYSLRFFLPVSDQPSVFLLDDIVWETE